MRYKTLRIHETTWRELKRAKPRFMPWDYFLRVLLSHSPPHTPTPSPKDSEDGQN